MSKLVWEDPMPISKDKKNSCTTSQKELLKALKSFTTEKDVGINQFIGILQDLLKKYENADN